MTKAGKIGTGALGFMVVAALAAVWLGSCAMYGNKADLPLEASTGPDPKLPAPDTSFIPTVNIAPADRWERGHMPRAAKGLKVQAFATGLQHPRWLYVLPNGDVLVAETNAPARPEDREGIKGFIMTAVQQVAGAAEPSADRIKLLRDENGDGEADTKLNLLDDLHSPFGMVYLDGWLYVANTDAIVRFPYKLGETEVSGPGVEIAQLPAGPINHHWTKNIVASRDGSKLYATVGSNSNAAENGIDKEERRAAILEVDRKTGKSRVYAGGLRNPNGMDRQPETGELWVVVNERDELGSDLVPDYLTSVEEGGFYGWPWSYWGDHVDERVKPRNPNMVDKAIVPDYALGNHVAALGLVFARGDLMPARFRGGAFVGEHGSWNRTPQSGYQVVFIPFEKGVPAGKPVDVLTGFLGEDGDAHGRPVGVAMAKDGALLVADDVGDTVWRVAPGEEETANR